MSPCFTFLFIIILILAFKNNVENKSSHCIQNFRGVKINGISKFFEKIYQLSVDIKEKKDDNVCVDVLSMGMSDDYADAIACGSTMIRVGTAIFGARDYATLHHK